MKSATCMLLLAVAFTSGGAAQTPSVADYLYRTQTHDTLIGLSRRLLKDPRQWRALQSRNAIAVPTRIPVGTQIRIPREWLRNQAETATVTTVVGLVKGDGATLKAGDSLREGADIDTAPGAYATITLADGSVVTLNASSRLQLARLRRYEGTGRRDMELKLNSGSVETRVKPQGDAGRFQIRTPVALSAVRGTEFRRAVGGANGADKTEVIVGSVGVSGVATPASAASGVLVPSGYGTISDADGGPRAPVKLLPPPDLSAVPPRFEDDTLTFSFLAVESARAYHAQIATDAVFQSIVADVNAVNPEISAPGLPDGRYWLRVRSQDRDGLEGADAVHVFERRRVPSPPRLEAPRTDAYVVGDGAGFRWAPAAGAAGYHFQLSGDREFERVAIDREHLAEVELALPTLAAGPYFWRIASVDSAGNAGRWSGPQRFVQKHAPRPLPPPTLRGKSMELDWTGEPDQRYELQVTRDPDFHNLVETQHLSSAHAVLHPSGAGTYYVRMRATDSDGFEGPFTPAQRFTAPLPWWVKLLPLLLVIPFL